MGKIILASTSPRRHELLAQAGVKFEILAPGVEEIDPPGLSTQEIVLHHALSKAQTVSALHPHAVVIGADTLVALDGRVFGKPRDMEHARHMLAQLQGRTHSVFTGVVVLREDPRLHKAFVTETRVTFHALDAAAIDTYLSKIEPLDKAGAYAAQDHGRDIIASIDGFESNVIGLPIEELLLVLEAE